MYELGDNSVHLIITKPRFPMLQKWDSYYPEIDFEKQHRFLKQTWQECYRILIDGGICCISVADVTRNINKRFECYPNSAKISLICRDLGFSNLISILTVNLEHSQPMFFGSSFLPCNGYIKQRFETILILRKGSIRRFKKDEKQNREYSAFSKSERDIWFQQLWTYSDRSRSDDLSELIVHRLIRMYSIIGDLVVDPFVESCSSVGRCAIELDRRFIGYYNSIREGKSTVLIGSKSQKR